jgi:hypothetical protein
MGVGSALIHCSLGMVLSVEFHLPEGFVFQKVTSTLCFQEAIP